MIGMAIFGCAILVGFIYAEFHLISDLVQRAFGVCFSFSLKDSQLGDRICNEILSAYLSDTRKARHLHSDGSYSLPLHRSGHRNGKRFGSQCFFIDLAEGKRTVEALPVKLEIPFGTDSEQEELAPKQMATVAS